MVYENGVLQAEYNGTVTFNDVTYYIKNGKVMQ